jgi:hypothetical protein
MRCLRYCRCEFNFCRSEVTFFWPIGRSLQPFGCRFVEVAHEKSMEAYVSSPKRARRARKLPETSDYLARRLESLADDALHLGYSSTAQHLIHLARFVCQDQSVAAAARPDHGETKSVSAITP